MLGIEIALRQALNSQCRYKMGAVLASGSRIFAAAPNKRRNSPTIDFRHSTFHAEEAVVRKVRRTSGREIYVARVDASAHPALARPCRRCLTMLARAGIVRAYYTVSSDTIGVAVPPRGYCQPHEDALLSWSF